MLLSVPIHSSHSPGRNRINSEKKIKYMEKTRNLVIVEMNRLRYSPEQTINLKVLINGK